MQLLLFRSLWTNGFQLNAALADCATGVFDGVEGPVPDEALERESFRQKLTAAGVPFLAEVCTATTLGIYVPERAATVAEHLESFERRITNSLECAPLFITSMAGCDAWPLAMNVDFFGGAMEIATRLGVEVSFEIHRARSMFNPWIARDILQQLPAMRLTCDYSHWCSVCERLIDSEPEVLALCASKARHIHARVGYDQGAQVPHPAAPEYDDALKAHERWWRQIWRELAKRETETVTMTPEFGPDGYLHTLPFTRTPVASLDSINTWMAKRQRQRFAKWLEDGAD
jgi:sugar phosphate isomerase/epimerase